MDYKNYEPTTQCFLSDDDIGEHPNTHTQCVLHIIRLRLIIFHTPKNFHGRNKIE